MYRWTVWVLIKSIRKKIKGPRSKQNASYLLTCVKRLRLARSKILLQRRSRWWDCAKVRELFARVEWRFWRSKIDHKTYSMLHLVRDSTRLVHTPNYVQSEDMVHTKFAKNVIQKQDHAAILLLACGLRLLPMLTSEVQLSGGSRNKFPIPITQGAIEASRFYQIDRTSDSKTDHTIR